MKVYTYQDVRRKNRVGDQGSVPLITFFFDFLLI